MIFHPKKWFDTCTEASDMGEVTAWGKPQYQHRLGDEKVESNPAEKGVGVLVGEKLEVSWHRVLTVQSQ